MRPRSAAANDPETGRQSSIDASLAGSLAPPHCEYGAKGTVPQQTRGCCSCFAALANGLAAFAEFMVELKKQPHLTPRVSRIDPTLDSLRRVYGDLVDLRQFAGTTSFRCSDYAVVPRWTWCVAAVSGPESPVGEVSSRRSSSSAGTDAGTQSICGSSNLSDGLKDSSANQGAPTGAGRAMDRNLHVPAPPTG